MVAENIRLHLAYLKVALNTALEYRMNFIIQLITMILNDVVWIVFWGLFFHRFTQVGSWEFSDIVMLYTIVTISFGWSGTLFGNRNKIAEMISEGKLDFYLTLPKNILYHLLITRVNWFFLGDLVFGLILAFIAVPLRQLPLLFFFCLTGGIIFIAFAVIVSSLSFFLGDTRNLSRNLFMGTIAISTYPFSVFKGLARFILLVLVPAGFISGVPVELLRSFDLFWFMATIGFAMIMLIISLLIFYLGLRRYESGNLSYVRV